MRRPFFVVLSAISMTGCHLSMASIANAPRSSPLVGHVHEDVFFSPQLGVQKHLMVYLPPSYDADTSRRFPVAYYLHGLGGSEGDWVTKGNIGPTADSLFAAGTPQMIIVMPDGDDGWYTTWARQVPYRTCADTVRVEAPERYCVEHERYDEYVARDVVSFIDEHYRTRADREHRGVGGLSMGGYGAITLALHFPRIFSAAASHSGVVSPMLVRKPPALPIVYAESGTDPRLRSVPFYARYENFWGDDITQWRQADPAHSAEALEDQHGEFPALFIDCGVEDPYVDQNRALHLELDRLGIRHTYAEWPGAHTWRYWSTHVGESLAWMGRRIG